MPNRIFCLIALTVLILISAAQCCTAAGVNTIRLSASRMALMADGKQTTDLSANVRDGSGRPVSGVQVLFSTTAGQLSQAQQTTDFSGAAHVRLTSAPQPGVAHVIATASTGAVDTIDVEFTDDPEATFAGNNYLSFAAKTYLAYSASDRIVTGEGVNGGARMTFRNLEINADRIQFRCDDNILRARDNIVLKRGGHKLTLDRLYLNLGTGEGWAIRQGANGLPETVRLFPSVIREPEVSKTPAPLSYMNIPDPQTSLVIVSKGIIYFPNDRLQFHGAKFLQNNVQVLSMQYYELGLHDDQLFTDQFISVGTSGFGMQIPYYYQMSPSKEGEIIIRHQQQIGVGNYAIDPGWGIDIIQSYNTSNGDRKSEGAFGFTGLTRNDWDFAWTHSQQFSNSTQGAFDLEFPNHDSIYSSMNLTQQYNKWRWGANLSGGETFLSDQTEATSANLYLETQPHPLNGWKNMVYTVGATFDTTHNQSADQTVIPNLTQTQYGLNFHAFSKPIAIDPRTSFTDSFTLGNTWAGSYGEGFTGLATLQLNRSLPGGGAFNLTYDLLIQPEALYDETGRHRISAAYNISKIKRLTLQFFGSIYLDAPNSSILGDMTYRLSSLWRIMGLATVERYGALSYTDFELTVGRRIGARELQFTYSTYLKRFSVNFTATSFK